ncbi:MAG: hypothetical protein ACRD8O_16410 [Bryobacteraceae bacterium]
MKACLLALALSSALLAGDTLDVFGHRWTVLQASDWAVEDGVLKLLTSAGPLPGVPRRPRQFALAETPPFRKVTVEAEIRRGKRSLILVYAWQDESHFNYAHISSDTAAKQPVHNGMFHVFGGERVRISALDGPDSLPTQEWTPVKLVFDGDAGRCHVEVNGKRNDSLDAVDLSLRFGRVGLGSFDEIGDFRKVKITGTPRSDGVVGRK